MYCDEAAYMPTALFYEVIVPIIEMAMAVLVMISTLSDLMNYYTKMLDKGQLMMAEGRAKYLVYRLELICERCKKRGNAGFDCRHKLSSIPPWKSEEKLNLVEEIMGAENIDILLKESKNIIGDSTSRVFSVESLDKFRKRPHAERHPLVKPKKLFLAIDPSAGGTSEVSLVLATRDLGNTLVWRAPPPHPLARCRCLCLCVLGQIGPAEVMITPFSGGSSLGAASMIWGYI